jgi:hypothetical protein
MTIKLVASGLPKTLDDYQVALDCAFAAGQAYGKAVEKKDTEYFQEKYNTLKEKITKSAADPRAWFSPQLKDDQVIWVVTTERKMPIHTGNGVVYHPRPLIDI